jgi:hypothetical protein
MRSELKSECVGEGELNPMRLLQKSLGVIPAEAGIQVFRHSFWTPASAGVTEFESSTRGSYVRGYRL